MAEKNNLIIRNALKKKGWPYWRGAEALGVSENTFYRKLRHELPENVQREIAGVILKAKAKVNAEG